MNALLAWVRVMLQLSVAAMCGLAFVWPFAVSPDPSHSGFRIAAIAALVTFLTALTVVLACKARRTSC